MSYLRYFSQANGQPNRVRCSITLLCNRVHAVCVPACDFALHAAASLHERHVDSYHSFTCKPLHSSTLLLPTVHVVRLVWWK